MTKGLISSLCKIINHIQPLNFLQWAIGAGGSEDEWGRWQFQAWNTSWPLCGQIPQSMQYQDWPFDFLQELVRA
jgi:hypothetical protein